MNDLADKIEQQIYLRYGPWCDIGLERKEWQQIIAALRRGSERPPSGEMVMVPMPDAIVAVGAQSVQLSYFGGNRNEVIALLKRSAAESSKEAK